MAPACFFSSSLVLSPPLLTRTGPKASYGAFDLQTRQASPEKLRSITRRPWTSKHRMAIRVHVYDATRARRGAIQGGCTHSPGDETFFFANAYPPGTFDVGSCGVALNSTTRRHPRLGLVAVSRGPTPTQIHIRGLCHLPLGRSRSHSD